MRNIHEYRNPEYNETLISGSSFVQFLLEGAGVGMWIMRRGISMNYRDGDS